MTDIEDFEIRILSCLDEVLHNISAADEAGNEIPFLYSLRVKDTQGRRRYEELHKGRRNI
jgi:hypothetical protein